MPPYSSAVTVAIVPRIATPGTNSAISRNDRALATRTSWLSCSKICPLRGSRRNACTARMPASDSTNCTISAALATRVRRYAANERDRNHRDSAYSGRNVASVTSASGRSRMSRITPIETTDSSAVTSPSRPSSSSSSSASTSEVSRAMTRPEV